MSNTPQKLRISPGPNLHGVGSIASQLREIMNQIIRDSQQSREQIMDLMNVILGERLVSVAQINGWTRDAKPRHIPTQYIFAFELACGSTAVTEFMCKQHHGTFITRDQLPVLELGRIEASKIQLSLKIKEIEQELTQ